MVNIKEKAIKTIKLLANKDISSIRMKQLEKSLLHFICSLRILFFLAWFFSEMLVIPYAHQPNQNNFPQNEKNGLSSHK